MTRNPPIQRRGRPPLDLAERLRNCGWALLVRAISKLSDDKLDDRYAGAEEYQRLRLFFQIRTVGSSPNVRRGGRSKRSAYERVHEDSRFAMAKAWYESELWTMLTDPALGTSYFKSYVERFIERHPAGLYRVSPEDIELAELTLGYDEPGLQAGLGGEYSSMLHWLSERDDIDALAMLCALFREAHADYCLEVAVAYKQVIPLTARMICARMGFSPEFGLLFENLLEDRILRNVWLSERHASPPVKQRVSRRRQIQEFSNWYRGSENPARRASAAQFPVVLRDQRIQWLLEHRERLHQMTDGLLKRPEAAPFGYVVTEDAGVKLKAAVTAQLNQQAQLADRLRKASAEIPARTSHNCLPVVTSSFSDLPSPR